MIRSLLASQSLVLGGVLLTATMAVAESPPPEIGNDARTRETMASIFSDLQRLLPATITGRLEDPARKAEFEASFRRMAERAEALTQHGSPLPVGSRLFAGALAQDTRRAEAFFKNKDFDSASFLVVSIVEDCTACHTRHKSEDSLVSQGFVSSADLEALDTLDRAALAVATRRFDEGLSLYEKAFAEPRAATEIFLDPITNYLTTALRVTQQPARAARAIEKLAKTPDLPTHVQEDLTAWLATLRKTTPESLRGQTLDDARRALSQAKEAQRHPTDWRPLVDFLVVSAQLHDLSTRPQEGPARVAEIFELLGEAELGLAQNMWQSRADLYWESAIRAAPGSAAAKRAFASLDSEVRAGFTGSGGLQLPEDEAARLADLRALAHAESVNAADGKRLFAQHCALCHGADGRGYGPLAQELMWIPADLTRIATRRGGSFPEKEVFGLIARRDPLGSHQSPEMPRWGEFWADDSKIDSLVAFLRTIQQP